MSRSSFDTSQPVSYHIPYVFEKFNQNLLISEGEAPYQAYSGTNDRAQGIPDMKREVQIYHHLGLGDHIICNGLIRELCKTNDKIYCFVKNQNTDSVAFMFRDEPKIKLISVADDWEVASKTRDDIPLIKIGFEKLDGSLSNFDENFYSQLGFAFSLRWDNFFIERDYGKEAELLQKVNPHDAPFVFVHDDPSRGLNVDLSLLRDDFKIIRASEYYAKGRLATEFQGYTLFHWISVLEKAEEIHCMDSSFKCLIESLPDLDHPTLFFHGYVRGRGPRQVCSTRKNWIVVRAPSLFFMAKSFIDRIRGKFLNNHG